MLVNFYLCSILTISYKFCYYKVNLKITKYLLRVLIFMGCRQNKTLSIIVLKLIVLRLKFCNQVSIDPNMIVLQKKKKKKLEMQ